MSLDYNENQKIFLDTLSEIDSKKLSISRINIDPLQEKLKYKNNPILWRMATRGLPIIVDWYYRAAPSIKDGDNFGLFSISMREMFLAYLKDSIISQELSLIRDAMASELQGKKAMAVPANLKTTMLNFLINLADQMVTNKVKIVIVNQGKDVKEQSWSNRFFANPSDEKARNFLNLIRNLLTGYFLINENGNWKFLDNYFIKALDSINIVELTKIRSEKRLSMDSKLATSASFAEFSEKLFIHPVGPLFYFDGFDKNSFILNNNNELESTQSNTL